MALYYNVKGASVSGGQETTELIAPGVSKSPISHIQLTNTQDTADVTVTLFIQDDPTSGTTSTYKIINLVVIPAGSSLSLDNPRMFAFSSTYGLYITVGSSDTIDVMIN